MGGAGMMLGEYKTVRLSVQAQVFGAWCVHQSVGAANGHGAPLWMVSHVRTGASLGALLGDGTDIDTARAIAEDIGSEPLLNIRSPEDVTDEIKYLVHAIVGARLETENP